MKPIHIEAKTISDAWFQLLINIFGNSYIQDIQRGSFEKEQHRKQYPGASIYIEYPDQDIVPIIPAGLGIPSPTDMEYIENYFANYLMDPELSENETYRYSSRIHKTIRVHPDHDSPLTTQLTEVIDMLQKTPMTNHAVIEIAQPSDMTCCIGNDGKNDPPCLRVIDFKVLPVKCDHAEMCQTIDPNGEAASCTLGYRCIAGHKLVLSVSVYFRSWDLWAGLPSNLGGIELLKQYVASETGLYNGSMYAYSAGLHIYGYQEEIARIRTAKQE